MADNVAASYRALGLRIGATPEEVKHAYRDLIKIWHPDRFPDNAELRARAHDRAAELTAAYDCVQEHLRSKPPHANSDHAHSPPPVYSASRNEPPLHPSIRVDGSRRDYRLVRCRRCGYRNPFPRNAEVLKCRKCGGDPMQRPGPASTGHPAPHPSDIRPDGSHRDYANAKLIRCQQCGHRNVFPRDSAVLKCHKCGGDPTQPRRPIPAPWPKARPPLAPEQAAHYRNIALMSRTTAIMGLLPGILLAGITVTTIAPEAEGRSYDQGTAPGLFLFVLLVGYVSLAITLGRGRHPGLGPALAVCMLALVLGLVVGAAHRVPADHPGYGTAVGLSVALLITGLTAAVEAVAATSMLRGALLFYDRKVAIQGLVLGILDLTVGAATLACCR